MKFDMSDVFRAMPRVKAAMENTQVEVAQKITLDIHADIVAATPVDNGDARQGWTVETPTKIGMDGVVENTVPYIVQLNRGHSKQAPPGYVDNAVNNAVRKAGK